VRRSVLYLLNMVSAWVDLAVVADTVIAWTHGDISDPAIALAPPGVGTTGDPVCVLPTVSADPAPSTLIGISDPVAALDGSDGRAVGDPLCVMPTVSVDPTPGTSGEVSDPVVVPPQDPPVALAVCFLF
jgi:hypothetical protein